MNKISAEKRVDCDDMSQEIPLVSLSISIACVGITRQLFSRLFLDSYSNFIPTTLFSLNRGDFITVRLGLNPEYYAIYLGEFNSEPYIVCLNEDPTSSFYVKKAPLSGEYKKNKTKISLARRSPGVMRFKEVLAEDIDYISLAKEAEEFASSLYFVAGTRKKADYLNLVLGDCFSDADSYELEDSLVEKALLDLIKDENLYLENTYLKKGDDLRFKNLVNLILDDQESTDNKKAFKQADTFLKSLYDITEDIKDSNLVSEVSINATKDYLLFLRYLKNVKSNKKQTYTIDSARRKRPKKLKCKPGFEQRGAACQPKSNKRKELEDFSIRELQQIARDEGIYRANHHPKSELVSMIKQLRSRTASEEESVRKTLNKRTQSVYNGPLTSDEVRLKSHRDRSIRRVMNAISPPAAKFYDAMTKASNINDTAVAGAIATISLLGLSHTGYKNFKKNYTEGLIVSAEEAEAIAYSNSKVPVQVKSDRHFTFVVGGANDSSDEMIAHLKKAKVFNSKNATNDTNFVNVDAFDPSYKKTKNKSDPIEHYVEQVKAYAGVVGRNIKGVLDPDSWLVNPVPRNPRAVELAAQIYAHASTPVEIAGTGKTKTLPINIIASGTGGVEAREAIEILQRMNTLDKQGRVVVDGRDIAKQVRLLTIGTPNFGMSDLPQERNLQSRGDILARPAKANTKKIENVRQHKLQNYLSESVVQKTISFWLNKRQTTPRSRRRKINPNIP